jgi:hypothetical protein
MDQGPLVIDQTDVGAKFLRKFQNYMPIQSAFWLRELEADGWNLYVASGQITDDSFDVGYGEVLNVAQTLQDPLFDPFQVKLINADDPLAKAAQDINARFRGPVGTRSNGRVFGGLPVEEVSIYPTPIPGPAV